jgi:hypothetical protein
LLHGNGRGLEPLEVRARRLETVKRMLGGWVMDDFLKVIGAAAIAIFCAAFIIMAITLTTGKTLLLGSWSCTDFNIKEQQCVKYEYVGKT